MTKAQYELVKNDAHHLALDIGVRPAARALGLSESRVQKWSHREKWNIGLLRPRSISNGDNGLTALEPGGTNGAIEAKRRILEHYSDRAKVGLAIATSKVAEHMAELDAPKLATPGVSISADAWSKVSDRNFGWTQARAQGANVAVQVNITPPSEAERAERRQVHAALDAIAKRLASSP